MVLFIITTFIICTAFNKTKIVHPGDYRDSYTGAYFCRRSSTTINLGAPAKVKKDTITVYVTKDVIDSVLQISMSNSVNKFILRNGILTEYPNEGHSGGKFFASDSIRLNILFGHGYQSRLVGKKK